jgi:CubicO group peptidase (beta-lactamase class C family)
MLKKLWWVAFICLQSQNLMAIETAAFNSAMQAKGLRLGSDFTGVAAVAQQGQLVWHFAGRDGKNDPLTTLDTFTLASQSKQITATLVMQAIEQQKLTLDTPLSQILPEHAARFAEPILIRHLLSHSSGLAGLDKPLQAKPGTQFAYSNLGYDILGKVLAVVYQKPYASVANELFAKCQLLNTVVPTADLPTSQVPRLVPGFMEHAGQLQLAPLDVYDQSAPSGRIVSSASDMLQFMHCLHETPLLIAISHQQMVQPYFARKHRFGSVYYGFGLQVSEIEGLTEWSHSGYVDGYISTTLYYPQTRLSVVVLEPLSLAPDNMDRVFYYHDQLRLAVRAQLLVGAIPPVSAPKAVMLKGML